MGGACIYLIRLDIFLFLFFLLFSQPPTSSHCYYLRTSLIPIHSFKQLEYISFTFACASMAHYIYSKAPDRALLSPDWRVKDETSLAILRTPLIRSWRPREASNGFHIYENEPAFIPGKTTNEKSSKKEYDRRANRAIEERRSIRVGNLLSKTTNQDVHDFFIKAGYAV